MQMENNSSDNMEECDYVLPVSGRGEEGKGVEKNVAKHHISRGTFHTILHMYDW